MEGRWEGGGGERERREDKGRERRSASHEGGWRVRRCERAQEKSAQHSGLSVFTDLFVFCVCVCVCACECVRVLFRENNKEPLPRTLCTTSSLTPLRKHIASQPKWQLLENQWLFTEESTPRGRRGDVYKTRDSRIFSLPRSPPPVCCVSNCCSTQTRCSSPRLLRGPQPSRTARRFKRFKRHFAVTLKTAF